MRVSKMNEPIRTLVLQATKSAGSYQPNEALPYIEEHLTINQYHDLCRFLNWIIKEDLTFGFGTIDLRWHEFKHNLTPVDKESAYQWAANREGF